MWPFIAPTQRTNALASFGNGGSADAMDDDAVAVVLGGQAAAAAREHVDLDTRRRTSCSESLRTWRPSPPSITGGYSQEMSRTRIADALTLPAGRSTRS